MRVPAFIIAIVFALQFWNATAHGATPPNIVFIFADDWGWGDLGCHGHPYVKTPNIDALAKEGTEFYQFTVCLLYTSPSPRDATLSRMPSSA